MTTSEPALQQDIVRAVEGAMWQDSLLQTYRQLQLGLQSVLIAVLVGLAVLVSTLQELNAALLSWTLLLVVFLFASHSQQTVRKIVSDKQKGVRDWEQRIKTLEEHLPADRRYYTIHMLGFTSE